jgi:hypothetical protein
MERAEGAGLRTRWIFSLLRVPRMVTRKQGSKQVINGSHDSKILEPKQGEVEQAITSTSINGSRRQCLLLHY